MNNLMTSIKNKTCIPCESGTKPITGGDILTYLPQLQSDWNVIAGKKIQREFSFKDFTDAMEFVNKVANIAESEGHHPDISIHYNKVMIELWTHAIDGLSENDFIVAGRIEALILQN
jgi:4a-hydroxytetrahydrobiopterin dehydratase